MVRIVFQKEFVSPVFGLVYLGKTVETSAQMAEKFVALGYAAVVPDAPIESPASTPAPKPKSRRRRR